MYLFIKRDFKYCNYNDYKRWITSQVSATSRGDSLRQNIVRPQKNIVISLIRAQPVF